jgi:tRNA-dihydrouridine synthase 1
MVTTDQWLTAADWRGQAWRMLTRSFLPEAEQSSLLAYTPMLHARLFEQEEKYRRAHFQARRPGSSEAWLDGNPALDRPLFVQFCANDPEALLGAARLVAPHCDAVDLNLGCPQGIARKGRYGAFLQEDQELIFRLINTLHRELSVPVTAKIRVLETREATLAYAQNVLRAGASILTVHGRRREQKGHLTGTADWDMLRFLRESLPPETVLFFNGNVLQPGDVQQCLDATGADGVMSAEGNLSDPAIFARVPAVGEEGREFWRGKDGLGGWRVDAIARRYLDLLHKYVDGNEPPTRRPLFVPGDDTAWLEEADKAAEEEDNNNNNGEPPRKKRKQQGGGGGGSGGDKKAEPSPNLSAVQPHLFHLLRHLVTRHTDVRDMLARSPRQAQAQGLAAYEQVLAAVERKVAEGLLEFERTGGASYHEAEQAPLLAREDGPQGESSVPTLKRCRRPWWVAQPIIRPLPSEAMAKGAIRPSKKELKEQKQQQQQQQDKAKNVDSGKGEEKEEVAAVAMAPAEVSTTKSEDKQDITEAHEVSEKRKEIAARDELLSG